MGNEELRTILNIYFDPDLETAASTAENLREAGIDSEKFIKDMVVVLEEKIAEQRIQGGKKFKEDYHRLLDKEKGSELLETESAGLSYAYRKLENLSEEEIEEIKKDEKKLMLLKKLLRRNERNSEG